MLYDTLTPDQVVDSEAALEFMKEATKLATAAELEGIGLDLEAKSAVVRAALAPESIESMGKEGLQDLLGWMFSLRRKAGRLIRANGLETLREELLELVHGDAEPGARVERFAGRIGGLEEAMVLSMATEALHFYEPRRYWLWTHWIWNPARGTGALALVTQEGVSLKGASLEDNYVNVGRATAMINAEGHATGYASSGRGLFGTDIFLACVYSVYMYTVFRVKLSQEFNRILPELPELVERVLGVRQFAMTRRGASDDQETPDGG